MVEIWKAALNRKYTNNLKDSHEPS